MRVKRDLTTLSQTSRDAAAQAARVEYGTTPGQRVISGTISTLPDIVAQSIVTVPTLLTIGTVVALREKLKWFESAAVSGGKFI